MSLQIVRDSITKIKVDAIVNPTDNRFSGSGGVDKQVHKAAGIELKNVCNRLESLKVGEAIITDAFKMNNTKYIIHTVGPIYQDGKHHEERYLSNCYKNTLKIAAENNIETIAMPLISTGTFGYPKKKALKTARNVIKEFLKDHEMDVFLLVYDKDAFDISKKLYKDIKNYLNANGIFDSKEEKEEYKRNYCELNNIRDSRIEPIVLMSKHCSSGSHGMPNMKDFVPDESFNEYLRRIMIEKDLYPKDLCEASNLTKQAFNRIYNENVTPKKENALALAIGLKLDIDETKDFLQKAGYALYKKGKKLDYIVTYYIEEGMYDIGDINDFLFDNDLPTLGSRYE